MLSISIPASFVPERSYSIEILIHECLGLNYSLITDPLISDYHICLPNNDNIIIEDHFFSGIPDNNSYIKEANIPVSVDYFDQRFADEKKIPIIYGRNFLSVDQSNLNKIITCGADIFASSFFMLSRWEESAIKYRDKRQRFDDDLSLSRRIGFDQRAIVNEYSLLLKNIIEYCGYNAMHGTRFYSVRPTHDVDLFFRYRSYRDIFRAIGGDLMISNSPSQCYNTLKEFAGIKMKKRKDPYDNFDFLMSTSESLGLASLFYFIPADGKEYGCNYLLSDKFVKPTITKIISRGHSIGLHSSYNSYNDKRMLHTGFKRLSSVCPGISEGRQHYLRFDNPVTWQILDDCGLKTDSTLGFSSGGGFRCGICHEYSVFDIVTRKKLHLKEFPLIMMDAAMRKQYPDYKGFFDNAIYLADECKKHNGVFTFLWHNNSFNTPEWNRISCHYSEFLNSIT